MDQRLVHLMNAVRHHKFSLLSFLWWKCGTSTDPGSASCFFWHSPMPIVMEFGFRVPGTSFANTDHYILILQNGIVPLCHNDIGIWRSCQLHQAWTTGDPCTVLIHWKGLMRFYQVPGEMHSKWDLLDPWGPQMNGFRHQGPQYNWCQHSRCWNILKREVENDSLRLNLGQTCLQRLLAPPHPYWHIYQWQRARKWKADNIWIREHEHILNTYSHIDVSF